MCDKKKKICRNNLNIWGGEEIASEKIIWFGKVQESNLDMCFSDIFTNILTAYMRPAQVEYLHLLDMHKSYTK